MRTMARAVGFNSQPPEGGWRPHDVYEDAFNVSTHSRPKAAGRRVDDAAAWFEFQLTAARRRLETNVVQPPKIIVVSTHSRPKAAGFEENACTATERFQLTAARRRLETGRLFRRPFTWSFNSQPPEGGWHKANNTIFWPDGFNSQPPEGGLAE